MTGKKAEGHEETTGDIHLLIATLPVDLQTALRELAFEQLVEVVMDLGRVPEARLQDRTIPLGARTAGHEDISHVLALIGEFSEDNRAGIERTLHRISGIRNRKGQIIGLTLRVGRAIFGTIELLRDLIETGDNLLMLGPPGVGKTTKLREMARVLADEIGKRVIVIDTSNEIGGDGDIPHPGIGSARRMQVPRPERQHAVMIEAVENHMPEVIIVDEIGTEAEAAAARTIAERGVQLIGTAHGNSLENLIANPTLSDLIGGIQTVTLSDEEAKRRGTMKTITERKAPPTFDIVVELVDRDEAVINRKTAKAVDALLRGVPAGGERREQGGDGTIHIVEGVAPEEPAPKEKFVPPPKVPREGPTRIYPYAVSRDLVERVIRELRVSARTVGGVEQADLVLGLRARSEDMRLRRMMEVSDAPLHLVKRNASADIRRALTNYFNIVKGVDDDEVQAAVKEAEEAVRKVLEDGIPVALAPQRPTIRKLQHRIITRHKLDSTSIGSEPDRHLVIYPEE